jgi:hypothetical protein
MTTAAINAPISGRASNLVVSGAGALAGGELAASGGVAGDLLRD